MEENFGNLNIDEDEEIPVRFTEEDVDFVEDYSWCLVGQVLTESIVHFMSMRNTLANLWHPLRGISITNIGDKRGLFRFYNEIDFKKVRAQRGFLLLRLTMEDQEMEFGWDSCLIVQPIRMAQMISPWLREKPKEWVRTEEKISKEQGDIQTKENQFIKHNGEIKGRMGGHHGNNSKGNIQIRTKFFNELDNARVSIKGKEVIQEAEDRPIVLKEGKKRQRIQCEDQEETSYFEAIRSNVDNEIVSAVGKQTG
ncbi:hypothetical protein J1N35_022966 [Gossypium stocksii]|uniref:DUF4283 domain-containing protein n=1 Tax=Gossypium stocksii TaxID=47602 RepID=A0A9D3VHG1_9ROSI|nr:hypothetical protein J1N35_022966 [Gossypium stocksii]